MHVFITRVDVYQDKLQPVEANTEESRTEEKGPRPAKRRTGEEAMGQPSHIGRAILNRIACITNNLLQHNIINVRFAQIRSNDIEFLLVSKGARLKTGVPTPFLRSYMLRTCARTSKNYNNETTAKNLPERCKGVFRYLGLLVTWIVEQ